MSVERRRHIVLTNPALGGVAAASLRGGLPGLRQAGAAAGTDRAGAGLEPGFCSRRSGGRGGPLQAGLQGDRLACDPSNARDRSADPAGGRHLPEPLLRHESGRRGPAGSLQAGLVVPHHVHRACRPHDVHVGVSRHQLPRRNLVERPSDRGQHPDRRHAHRPRTRRLPMGEPGRVQHAGRQGHAGARAAGHRRRRTGGQLVRLDQLELSGIPRARKESGQREFVCLRPQCGHLEAGLPEGFRRLCSSARQRSTPNFRCRERIPRG